MNKNLKDFDVALSRIMKEARALDAKVTDATATMTAQLDVLCAHLTRAFEEGRSIDARLAALEARIAALEAKTGAP